MITNLEALNALFGYNTTNKEAVLLKNGLVPAETYTTKNESKINRSVIDCIVYVMSLPHTVRELDYQLTNQSISELMKLLAYYCDKEGLPNPLVRNKIKKANVW